MEIVSVKIQLIHIIILLLAATQGYIYALPFKEQ